MRQFTIAFRSAIRNEIKEREFDRLDSCHQLINTVSPKDYTIKDNEKGEEIEWVRNRRQVTPSPYSKLVAGDNVIWDISEDILARVTALLQKNDMELVVTGEVIDGVGLQVEKTVKPNEVVYKLK